MWLSFLLQDYSCDYSVIIIAEVHNWALGSRFEVNVDWHISSNQHTDRVNTTRPQQKNKSFTQNCTWINVGQENQNQNQNTLLINVSALSGASPGLTVFPCHCAIPGGWCPATCPDWSCHTDLTRGAVLKAYSLSVTGGSLECLNLPDSSLCTIPHLNCSLTPSYLCSPTQ